jgi:hypothetical protein
MRTSTQPALNHWVSLGVVFGMVEANSLRQNPAYSLRWPPGGVSPIW